MRTPTDRSYKIPTWMIFFFLAANLLGIWISIQMLKSRSKHSWPW